MNRRAPSWNEALDTADKLVHALVGKRVTIVSGPWIGLSGTVVKVLPRRVHGGFNVHMQDLSDGRPGTYVTEAINVREDKSQ